MGYISVVKIGKLKLSQCSKGLLVLFSLVALWHWLTYQSFILHFIICNVTCIYIDGMGNNIELCIGELLSSKCSKEWLMIFVSINL